MPQDVRIKTGYVVRLKSGGPDMTVTNIEGINVMCQSFENGVISDYTFNHEALNLVLANEPDRKSEEASLKAGDMVEFISSGPCMTAYLIVGSKVECQWFEKSLVRYHTFAHDTLRLVIAKEHGYAFEGASLATGDVVRLKSGGPKMTISLLTNSNVACQWFVRNILHEARFMREALLGPAVLQRIQEEIQDEVDRRNRKAWAEIDDYRREQEMNNHIPLD
jgi:uncharacterized protein YodC (DUF2158 family)